MEYVDHPRPDPERDVGPGMRRLACQCHGVVEQYLVGSNMKQQRWESREVPEDRRCQRGSGVGTVEVDASQVLQGGAAEYRVLRSARGRRRWSE
jgi:hypothetical protein